MHTDNVQSKGDSAMTNATLEHRIEELRQEIYRAMGSHYDPERFQSLVPISQELDRLVVELVRRELGTRGQSSNS
jgi:predicted ArsR family transcriptional regulator